MTTAEKGTPELKPCPWCKVPPEVCRAAGYGFTVECVNEVCPVGPSLNVTRGRANAIAAWNSRVNDKLLATNAALVKALQFCGDLAEEELGYSGICVSAEVALRHISRKAREALARTGESK